MKHSGQHTKQHGFTLIEIMVVVVILGILAALVAPNILSRPDQAKVTVARSDIEAIAQALELYRLDNGHYPSTDQGLEALVKKPTLSPIPQRWNPEGYLKKKPMDPWGNPYLYLYPGNRGTYDLYSLAADTREGGEGIHTDIGNWGAES
ncbi:type II secretion system major pseudopilin GspG [Endozoicomonas numazuensis]|uniref:Type II secretion system core protein G n=1 Tax=Endozoicomonas numazuensis TaxID=1137799 RepID=A0A081NHZ7_9GAMM|nr:type II secretion system major pseudopilin GspG [Endozoicomonas numazuensis]KEQ18070.1 secretion system protein G [Endozoicomonas numazuensis]